MFKEGEYVVYPTHGLGKVMGFETQTIADTNVDLMMVVFEKDRMILRIPTHKTASSGLRSLTTRERLNEIFESLTVKAKTRRTMWSRRAQEYDMKINSGDPMAIADVLRELFRNNKQSDQSYSERQIYQNALERLGREIAAIEGVELDKAFEIVESYLKKIA
jgi:CarD family transcriptional regulator